MTSLFDRYRLIKDSGLFDESYYRAAYPDVADVALDPVIHYLEWGGPELRNPSAAFDARRYAEVCRQRGEPVENPLLHYLEVGSTRGLTFQAVNGAPPPAAAAVADAVAVGRGTERDDLMLSIDLPLRVEGRVVTPIRGNLDIAGWAITRHGTAAIDILIDGRRIASACTGVRRIDVQRAFPDREGALTAGFSALVPHRSLPTGGHGVDIVLRDVAGETATARFRIDVEEAPDTDGPWALRRRMTPAEIDVLSQPLLGVDPPPSFDILLALPPGAAGLTAARATLASLAAQVHGHWHAWVISGGRDLKRQRRALFDGFEAPDRVRLVPGDRALDGRLDAGGAGSHRMVLQAGDELGCNALLELALHASRRPDADFLYCDERRRSPSSGKVEAFFKPQWSPDLLLSMNYLGRAWCVRTDLTRRAAVRPAELVRGGAYHLALRLTEHARAIEHVPAVLVQASPAFAEEAKVERAALRAALARRGIAAAVTAGRAPGSHRVRRRVAARGLVSIIIPTCAARGLIRTCLETLHAVTAYRRFEILCIENIPADQKDTKKWLRGTADKVLPAPGPFNWSRFNNRAVSASRGEFLLFLNDDIEIIDPSWLDVLIETAQRPEVGAVGPQLLYPDRRVQHAGMFLAGPGIARHAFRNAAEDDPGYFGLALAQREVIAVTGACLMTRRDTFEAVGRFDETHDVVNNDLDYCLRVRRAGLRTLYTPHARLVHHELASRSGLDDRYDAAAFEREWRSLFAAGDPYFHPHLSKERDDYSIDWEPIEVHCAGHPLIDRQAIRRILVVKLDHIGDCVTALPAIRRLKRHFPAARIAVLTGRSSKAVWALEPAIDELIDFDFFHARSSAGLMERSAADWQALEERLAPHQFDLAVDLRKHWETRKVLQHTGARYLAGFDMKGKFPWLDVAIEWAEDVALIRKRQQTSDELIQLIDAIATAGDPDRSVIGRPPAALPADALAGIAGARRIFSKRVVCVHPGVGNELRQWPARHFSLLIDQLVETQDVHVILVGGADEAALGADVLAAIRHRRSVWSLIGRLKLGDLPALIARCTLFVGNNSGPQHLAAGLGIPTIGIHSGVVDAREWGPLGPRALAIHRLMSCSPCYHSKREECSRAVACLSGLLPQHVMRLCERMLAQEHPRLT